MHAEVRLGEKSKWNKILTLDQREMRQNKRTVDFATKG